MGLLYQTLERPTIRPRQTWLVGAVVLGQLAKMKLGMSAGAHRAAPEPCEERRTCPRTGGGGGAWLLQRRRCDLPGSALPGAHEKLCGGAAEATDVRRSVPPLRRSSGRHADKPIMLEPTCLRMMTNDNDLQLNILLNLHLNLYLN